MNISWIIKEEIDNFKKSIISLDDDIINALKKYSGGKIELSHPGEELTFYDSAGEPLVGEQHEYEIVFSVYSDASWRASCRFPSRDQYDSDFDLYDDTFSVEIDEIYVYDENGNIIQTYIPEGEKYDKLVDALEDAISLDYNGDWMPTYNVRGDKI